MVPPSIPNIESNSLVTVNWGKNRLADQATTPSILFMRFNSGTSTYVKYCHFEQIRKDLVEHDYIKTVSLGIAQGYHGNHTGDSTGACIVISLLIISYYISNKNKPQREILSIIHDIISNKAGPHARAIRNAENPPINEGCNVGLYPAIAHMYQNELLSAENLIGEAGGNIFGDDIFKILNRLHEYNGNIGMSEYKIQINFILCSILLCSDFLIVCQSYTSDSTQSQY